MSQKPTVYQTEADQPITQPTNPSGIVDDRVRAVAEAVEEVKRTLSANFIDDPSTQLSSRYLDLAVQAAYGCAPAVTEDAGTPGTE